jgi:hypothetical protein
MHIQDPLFDIVFVAKSRFGNFLLGSDKGRGSFHWLQGVCEMKWTMIGEPYFRNLLRSAYILSTGLH